MTIVIFGGAGDLAHRKLLPALYNLHVDGLLPKQMAIVGVGRKAMSDAAYRDFAKDGVTKFSRRPIDNAAWQTFADALFFVAAEIDAEQGLAPLGARLDIIEHERGLEAERIYYLALPSSAGRCRLAGIRAVALLPARIDRRTADVSIARRPPGHG